MTWMGSKFKMKNRFPNETKGSLKTYLNGQNISTKKTCLLLGKHLINPSLTSFFWKLPLPWIQKAVLPQNPTTPLASNPTLNLMSRPTLHLMVSLVIGSGLRGVYWPLQLLIVGEHVICSREIVVKNREFV